jgi:hypothetical protein
MAMAEFTQGECAAAAGAALAAPVAAMLREAERWTRLQCELLSGIEAMWTQWMRRQRTAIDASAGTLRRLYGCRSFAEFVQVEQQWLADALRDGAAVSAGRAVAEDALALGQWRAAEVEAAPHCDVRDRPAPAPDTAALSADADELGTQRRHAAE